MSDRHIDADEIVEAMKQPGASFGAEHGGNIWHSPTGLAERLSTSYGRVRQKLEELADTRVVVRQAQGSDYWRLKA